MSEAILYQDHFLVNEVDPGKYDRVARVSGTSGDGQTSIAVDVNTELYPLSVGDSVQIALASTLNIDGTKDDERERGWREKPAKGTLAEDFDYVCHGKIYRFDELQEATAIRVYVSFGGLLLYLEAPYKKLTSLRVDHVYMLLRK